MIREVPGRRPRIHPGAWVDPSAQVIGDVEIGEGSSIWPGAIVRGDQDNHVRIGRNTNVQDGSVLHVTPEFPCLVGDNVTIGHRCVVHACTVMSNVRIGIGALVPPGKVVPAGWLVMGVPATPVRQMSPEEIEDILRNAREYVALWRRDYGKK